MDVSDIFYFFSPRGRGRGCPRRRDGGGGDFSMENPRRGVSRWVGAGGRGAGRVFAENLGGGGLNIFFRGRNAHQEADKKKKCNSKQFRETKRFAKQSVGIIRYFTVFGRIVLQNDLEGFVSFTCFSLHFWFPISGVVGTRFQLCF